MMNYEQLSKAEVMRKFNLTERQVNHDLDKVNHALDEINMPQVNIVDNCFIIDGKLKSAMRSGVLLDITPNQFIISEEDRMFLLYLYTFIRKEAISNYHYQLLLAVSKNTALADVKRVKELCQEWEIELVYTRVDGYHLKGSELDKRRLASYCIDMLLTQPLGKEILIIALKTWGYEDSLVLTQRLIDEWLVTSPISFVKSRKAEMITRLTFVRVRNKSDNMFFKEYEKQLIERQSLYELGKKLTNQLFPNGDEQESYYVTLQLLIAFQEIPYEENPSLVDLAERIIDEFEKVTLLPIDNKQSLKHSLYNHMVPAFFRISFELPIVNPLKDRIKDEYPELFQFVKKALAPLSMWTGKKISEEEIGFFTLHFGGYLKEERKPNDEQLRALIVCSNGISSSLMLKAQLNEMFPDIHLSRVRAAEEMTSIPASSYDLVFSTVDLVADKPLYILKPLLSQVEKNYLLQAVARDFPRSTNKNVSVDKLMAIIKKYADVKDDERLFSELVNVLYSQQSEKGRYSPLLSELLTKEMINFTDESLKWRDAIIKGSQPLVDSKRIEDRYVDAMIKNVEEVGTYIHIGKGIAIPHARPEAGVKEIGMSFLRTRTPVLLLDKEEHQIDIFITIAAIDNQAHLKALSHLTKLLSDKTKLQLLKAAETAEQIIEIIKEGE
jgi:PTS system ascorbate-specific IIA component